jgi:hypothetical protein
VACSCIRWPAMTIAHNFGCTGTSFPEHYSHDDGVLCGTVTCLIVAFSVFMFSATRQDRRGFSPEPRVRARAGDYLITFSTASRTVGADRCENLVVQWSFLLFFSEWMVTVSCGIW